jgi:hypothetical protein
VGLTVPRWLQKALARIHALADAGAIRFTNKARIEGALLGLSRNDVRELLAALTPRDFAGRRASTARPEWLYVFMPLVGEDEGGSDDKDAI